MQMSQKQEMFIFRPKRKGIDFNLKSKRNGKRLYETNPAKYFGMRIDNKLNWEAHVDDVAV